MKLKLKKIVFSAIFLLSIGLVIQAQTTDEPQILLPNQTIEREMRGAETHRYKFNLRKAEFFQVRVEQKGIDLMLKLTEVEGNIWGDNGQLTAS